MRTIFAPQYGTACIQLHEGDDVDEVIEQAEIEGALYEEEPGRYCYVVEFPGRFPELYTERALRGSFPVKGENMSHTKGKFIATLNSVYDDGSFAEITAIAVVKDEHEGEIWFGENKPDDGTQVDYVLHKVSLVFDHHMEMARKLSENAALKSQVEALREMRKDLLDACKSGKRFIVNGIELGYIKMPEIETDPAHKTLPLIEAAIAKAKKDWE